MKVAWSTLHFAGSKFVSQFSFMPPLPKMAPPTGGKGKSPTPSTSPAASSASRSEGLQPAPEGHAIADPSLAGWHQVLVNGLRTGSIEGWASGGLEAEPTGDDLTTLASRCEGLSCDKHRLRRSLRHRELMQTSWPVRGLLRRGWASWA